MVHRIEGRREIKQTKQSVVTRIDCLCKVRHHLQKSGALDWISFYLQGRRQVVMFDGGRSSVCKLSHGVPQGSILGSLLFLLYTADLGGLASKLGLSSNFYADDTQLYTTGPSPLIFSGGWNTALMSWWAG